jgi:hypothetical protein
LFVVAPLGDLYTSWFTPAEPWFAKKDKFFAEEDFFFAEEANVSVAPFAGGVGVVRLR